MKIKLVDVDSTNVEDVQFGTCELCMYTSDMTETRFKFEYSDGTTEWVDGFSWSWGDCFEVPHIESIPDFAAWLLERDFPDDFRMDFSELEHLAYDYLEENDLDY